MKSKPRWKYITVRDERYWVPPFIWQAPRAAQIAYARKVAAAARVLRKMTQPQA